MCIFSLRENCRNNMKKTWITIGESLNKHKKKSDLQLTTHLTFFVFNTE